MTKKLLLWGALPEVPKGEPYDLSLRRSGGNFGNMLIGNGVVSVLDGYEYLYREHLSGPEEADERCCHIVIPAANFLWKGFDFGFMADFIEATSLPVTIVGLGAQCSDRSTISEIHPNTLRLVKIISERSPALGVRGFYSAEVLAANGILNVEVLGCPSLYTNGRRPSPIKAPSEAALSNLAVNFSRRVAGHAFDPAILKNTENSLLDFAIDRNLPFIAQDEVEELELATGNIDGARLKEILRYFDEIEAHKIGSYFARNTRYFCNIPEWIDFLSTRSGVIGSRIHGTIAALIAGVPSLTLVHDSRTLEMCGLIGTPYVHIKSLSGQENLSQLLIDRLLSADYSVFSSNMSRLFERYKHFLDRHSLKNIL